MKNTWLRSKMKLFAVIKIHTEDSHAYSVCRHA